MRGIPQIVLGNGGVSMDVPVPIFDNNPDMLESYEAGTHSLVWNEFARDGKPVAEESIFTGFPHPAT